MERVDRDDHVEVQRADAPRTRLKLPALPLRSGDLLLIVLVAATAWWYYRISSRRFFAYDDWLVARRPSNLGDLLEHHNNHFSLIPLAVWKALFNVFGLETYVPFRLIGISSFVGLVVALYLLARTRLGDVPGALVAVSVLWIPTLPMTPFMFNFHLPLACAVACAWALPAVGRWADGVLLAALSVALATSSVGVAVAGACAVHAGLSGFKPRRWAVIAIPTLAWIVWWLTMGVRPGVPPGYELTFRGIVRLCLEGVLSSFAALAGASDVIGACLAVAFGLLFGWRLARDWAAFKSQLAWVTALGVWWWGVVSTRGSLGDPSDVPRYHYVSAVFIVLAALPVRRLPAVARMARSPAAFAFVAVAVPLAIWANHDDIRVTSRNWVIISDRVQQTLIEVEQGPGVVPDDTRLPPGLDPVTAGDYRRVVQDLGSPISFPPSADVQALDVRAVIVVLTGANHRVAACTSGEMPLSADAPLVVRTTDDPATVLARRFGDEPVPVRSIPPNITASVEVFGDPISAVPWLISTEGGCLSAS